MDDTGKAEALNTFLTSICRNKSWSQIS